MSTRTDPNHCNIAVDCRVKHQEQDCRSKTANNATHTKMHIHVPTHSISEDIVVRHVLEHLQSHAQVKSYNLEVYKIVGSASISPSLFLSACSSNSFQIYLTGSTNVCPFVCHCSFFNPSKILPYTTVLLDSQICLITRC